MRTRTAIQAYQMGYAHTCPRRAGAAALFIFSRVKVSPMRTPAFSAGSYDAALPSGMRLVMNLVSKVGLFFVLLGNSPGQQA